MTQKHPQRNPVGIGEFRQPPFYSLIKVQLAALNEKHRHAGYYELGSRGYDEAVSVANVLSILYFSISTASREPQTAEAS